MKRIIRSSCAFLLSLSMMGQACLPVFAQEEVEEENITEQNEEIDELDEQEDLETKEVIETENEEENLYTLYIEYYDWCMDCEIMQQQIQVGYDEMDSIPWHEYAPEGYDIIQNLGDLTHKDNEGIAKIYCARIGETRDVHVNWWNYGNELPESIEVEIKEEYIRDEIDFFQIYQRELENNIPEGFVYNGDLEFEDMNSIRSNAEKGSLIVDDVATVQYISFETNDVMETVEGVPFRIVENEDNWNTYENVWLGWHEALNNYENCIVNYFNQYEEHDGQYLVKNYVFEADMQGQITVYFKTYDDEVVEVSTLDVTIPDECDDIYDVFKNVVKENTPDGYVCENNINITSPDHVEMYVQQGEVSLSDYATIQFIDFDTREIRETVENVPFKVVSQEHEWDTDENVNVDWSEVSFDMSRVRTDYFNKYEEVNGKYLIKAYLFESGMEGDIQIKYQDFNKNEIVTSTVSITIPEDDFDFWNLFEDAARENVPEGYIFGHLEYCGLESICTVEEGSSESSTIQLTFVKWEDGTQIAEAIRDLEIITRDENVEYRYYWGLEDSDFDVLMNADVVEDHGNYSATILCANSGDSKHVQVTYYDVNSDYVQTRDFYVQIPGDIDDEQNYVEQVYGEILYSVPEGEWFYYNLYENGDIDVYFGMPSQTIQTTKVEYIDFETRDVLCTLEDIQLQLWNYSNESHKYCDVQIVGAQPHGFNTEEYYMDYFGEYSTDEDGYVVKVYCFKPGTTGIISIYYEEERAYYDEVINDWYHNKKDNYMDVAKHLPFTVPEDILETKDLWTPLCYLIFENEPEGCDSVAVEKAAVVCRASIVQGTVDIVPMTTNLIRWSNSTLMDQYNTDFLDVHLSDGTEQKRVNNWDWFLPEYYKEQFKYRTFGGEPELRNGKYEFDVYFANPDDTRVCNAKLVDITNNELLEERTVTVHYENDIDYVWEIINNYAQTKPFKDDYVLEFVEKIYEEDTQDPVYYAYLVPGTIVDQTTADVTYVDWASGQELGIVLNVPLEIIELRDKDAQQNLWFRLGKHHLKDFNYGDWARTYYVNYVEQEDGTYTVDEICLNYDTICPIVMNYYDDHGNFFYSWQEELYIKDYDGADPLYGSLDHKMQSLTLPEGYFVQKYDQVGRYEFDVILGHEKVETSMVEGYIVSLDGNVYLTAFFKFDVYVLLDEDAKVQFTINGRTITKDIHQIENEYEDPQTRDTYYGYVVEVSAKEMTDNITCQVLSSEMDSPIFNISIEQYAKYIMDNDYFSQSDKDTARALLTYGYYTQQYFNYQTGNLPDSEYIQTLDGNVDFSEYAYQLEDNNENLDFIGARLVLKSRPQIKLYFLGEAEFSVSYGNCNFETSTEGKYTVVTITDIYDLESMFTVSADNFSMEYGLFSYGYQAQRQNKTALIKLLQAMYNLNIAPYSY